MHSLHQELAVDKDPYLIQSGCCELCGEKARTRSTCAVTEQQQAAGRTILVSPGSEANLVFTGQAAFDHVSNYVPITKRVRLKKMKYNFAAMGIIPSLMGGARLDTCAADDARRMEFLL